MKRTANGSVVLALVALFFGTVQPVFGQTESQSDEGVFRLQPIDSADDEPGYADKPHWYKPGHPLQPAKAADIRTLPGFEVDEIFSVPEDFGSWTALAVDSQGRLLAAAQHRPGIFRITPPAVTMRDARASVERLTGVAGQIGWCQGLLYAHDSLWVVVSEENQHFKTGLYRLRDTDDDDQFDEIETIQTLDGSGEHGPHNIVAGPDGESLYMIGGNGTPLPTELIALRRPSATEGLDHLMPPGYLSSKYRIAGWVCRMDASGRNWELISSGLRNSYDLAFDALGELFTFDSDMENDLGAPWYRPTRICHLVSGGEFGWRDAAAKWPAYYEDSVAPVVDIGPASPTGIAFGYPTNFPSKYRRALFACDWTFATIHAIHLTPHGATYRADVEEFVSGAGLPVTDIVAAPDGALYFIVGGRRLVSALYRVRWVGEPSDAESDSLSSQPSQLHQLRRQIESNHLPSSADAIDQVWPHLNHDDRAIRFAARVAVEAQPLDVWRERAHSEPDQGRRLVAALALARKENPERQGQVVATLEASPWPEQSASHQLIALRAYELAFARGDATLRRGRSGLAAELLSRFPSSDDRVKREIARLVCFLGDPDAIEPLLDAMAGDLGERPMLGTGYFVRNPKYGKVVQSMFESAPRMSCMHYAQMLLWIEDGWTLAQRQRYFELIADAMENSKGGEAYLQFWNEIRELALKQVPDSQRQEFEAIRAQSAIALQNADLPVPEGPGREWTLEATLEAAVEGLHDRDAKNGRAMFAAAGCFLCHRVNGVGGDQGPDLSTLGRRFTLRDIVDSTINPSKTISDQYQMTMILTESGRVVSGRVIARSDDSIQVVTDLLNPHRSVAIANEEIASEQAVPVSTMPSELLNRLNEDELLDLLAYLVSGGDESHPVFQSR